MDPKIWDPKAPLVVALGVKGGTIGFRGDGFLTVFNSNF